MPFLIVALHFLAVMLYLGWDRFLILSGIMVAYILPPAGKETAIPLGIALGLPWWLVAVSIAMIDLEFGLFMVWNFDLILRIPGIGPLISRFTVEAERFVTGHPWIRRGAFLGIVLIVLSPVLGSGGIRGSIIGRMLGLGKGEVFAAIVLGAFSGSFLIALGAAYIRDLLIRDTAAGLTVIAVIILAALGGYAAYRYGRRDGKGASPPPV